MAIGRISGPLLKQNLLREGVNLAFENDLLYLDVNNSRVGINTNSPQYDLDVNGTTRSTSAEIANQADIGGLRILNNTIVSTNGDPIVLGTADNVVYQTNLLVDAFRIQDNVISTTISNENIELNPNGTGSVEIFGNTNVYGNIVATGSITADGDITIGDANTDEVIFNAEVASNIIPDIDSTYSLGSDPATGGKEWADVWVNNFYASNITTSSLTVAGVDLALRQGNIYYVAENGDDTYSGDHPNDPYGTVAKALSVATAGDTVHIYPGTFEEVFPLTIPVGVTVKGHSIRSVKIVPTAETNTNTAFLLNGETTVEDITIADFFAPGYAFKFANNFTVTTRSPYLRNISVLTKGSVTTASDPRGFDQGDAGGGAYLDGSLANISSREASCLFHSVTFITPGVDAISITNGVRVEWLNSFTYFANKGLYAFDSASGLKGAGKTAIRVSGVTGTIQAGQTFTYYDTDGITVLATGAVDSVDTDGKFYITGNLTGLTEAQDRAGKEVTRYNNPVTDTAIKKFGSSSLQLDGVEDYIGIASNDDFGFGTGDYTVEGWFYPTTAGNSRCIIDFRAGAGTDNAVFVGININNKPYFLVNNVAEIVATTSVTQNAWNHIALVKNSGTTTLYLNGVSQGTYADAVDYGVAKPLIIGNTFAATAAFAGYIDEFRVTKGLARYTANFGVPGGEFVSDANTVLLLHFNNAGDSSITIIDDTLESQDLRFVGLGGATADFVDLKDTTDFGGEIRSIASACVYGNYGAFGDGNGVLMYLIAQNFAYIGTGKDEDNDQTDVIQANEAVELNNAKVRYSSVDHKGDFRVGDLFYVNQENGTVDFTSTKLAIDTTDGITITTAGSTTTITGERIDTGNLRISGNTIESLSGDVNLSADSGVVKITSTGSLQLPKGNTASRPTPATGMIRYNTDTNLYEGYDGNWIALNGVYDLDLDSKITAELTPGANDGVIRYYVNGELIASMDDVKLETPVIEVDDISINGNVIETITTNTDLTLSANGTGRVVFDEIAIKDSSIINTTSNGVLYFQQSGSGYFKIEGTGGFVVPVGTNAERPVPAYRETGMTRFNSEQGYLELWDGLQWVSVAGATGSITFNQAESLAVEYVLTLG